MSSNNGGSRLSIYSHASTTRSTRTLGAHSRGVSLKSTRVPWWRRPLVASAFYTDLTTAAWHVTFYTLALSAWTGITSLFDCYLLEEAKPGSSHTGYYLFSFDFVYVGNHHVRNLLFFSGLTSIVGAIALFITSCIILDALRLEKERGFEAWLWTMGLFTPWKIVAWVYAAIVNDMTCCSSSYHIFMFLIWMVLNVANVFAWVVMYSLYLELQGISRLEGMAKMKMDTLSSRAGSLYGSRPTSPAMRGGSDSLARGSSGPTSSYGHHVPGRGPAPLPTTQFTSDF